MPGEFEIIDRYFVRQTPGRDVVIGIGDDAAVVRATEPLVVAVDTLVGGVHFPPDLPPRSIGHRALAVNLSDFAAMGAAPQWATLALTLPAADEQWLEAFAEGFFALADRHGVDLIGGDTTRGPLTVTVQLLGAARGGRVMTRGGGRVGDAIYVTGSLGEGAAAIALWAGRDETDWTAGVFARFAYPEPRVDAGLALVALASAAIDVSDGLVADLEHVCRASGCGARVDVERVPVSLALGAAVGSERALEYALTGGDDYELCFAAPAERETAIAAALRDCGIAVTRIGELVTGSGVTCLKDGVAIPIATAGFTHF